MPTQQRQLERWDDKASAWRVVASGTDEAMLLAMAAWLEGHLGERIYFIRITDKR
jgi:aminoglycoside phosphotransferase (APT) family kinase protein